MSLTRRGASFPPALPQHLPELLALGVLIVAPLPLPETSTVLVAPLPPPPPPAPAVARAEGNNVHRYFNPNRLVEPRTVPGQVATIGELPPVLPTAGVIGGVPGGPFTRASASTPA